MPINVYTGLMGSGKTFECVSSVIVPAIAKGRRVVSNIENLQIELIRSYASEKYSVPLEKCGELVCVENETLTNDNFYPDGTDKESIVHQGDMVCIDEAWQFYGSAIKLNENSMNFFRMHRHYVHPETKVSCDIVLMVQSITDLNRSLKLVVEFTFIFTKMKAIGMNTRYRVDLYQGHKTPIRSRVSSELKKYDKKVFPLYSSYQGGKGNEVAIDRRTNIFNSKKIYVLLVVILLMFGVGMYLVNSFFGGQLLSDGKSTEPQNKQQITASPASIAHQQPQESTQSSRLIGSIERNGMLTYIGEDQGRLVAIYPGSVYGTGITATAIVDGKTYHFKIETPQSTQQ